MKREHQKQNVNYVMQGALLLTLSWIERANRTKYRSVGNRPFIDKFIYNSAAPASQRAVYLDNLSI